MTINCPLCNSSSYKILYNSNLKKSDFKKAKIKEDLKNTLGDFKKHGQIVKCTKCSLVYVNPPENISDLLEGYKNVVDAKYIETEKFRKYLLKVHLKILEKFKKNGRILDVGCFAGFFLELAKINNWEIFGIEPSKWASLLASKKGVQILGDKIETTKINNGYFDAITFWDVIEHLSDPNIVLKKCYQALKHDGVIAFATPNIDSFMAKVLGGKFPYLIRMHLIFYSPSSLKKMLIKHGFKVIYSGSYSRTYPLYYILERIRGKKIFPSKMEYLINSRSILGNITLPVNLRDEFIMIAKKI